METEIKNNWTIYEHVSPSGKVYVGITLKPVYKRWRPNGNGYLFRTNGRYVHSLFANAILKYGWENFLHIIIATNLGEKTAKNMEKDLIAFNKDKGISYNITDGGDGRLGATFHHSEEAKNKISSHHRRCLTQETIEKLRLCNLGKKLSDEIKLKFRLAHQKERTPVCLYNKLHLLINEYESIMDASRATGVRSGNICNSCKKRGSAGGYLWEYKIFN